jgi:hypothetical protein
MAIEPEMAALFVATYNADFAELGSLSRVAWSDQDKHPTCLNSATEAANCSPSSPWKPNRKWLQSPAGSTPRAT